MTPMQLCLIRSVFPSQKEQRRRTERTEEGVGFVQHDGAQPPAVLHLPPVAEQVQDLCWARTHFQQRLPVFAWRCVQLRSHHTKSAQRSKSPWTEIPFFFLPVFKSLVLPEPSKHSFCFHLLLLIFFCCLWQSRVFPLLCSRLPIGVLLLFVLMIILSCYGSGEGTSLRRVQVPFLIFSAVVSERTRNGRAANWNWKERRNFIRKKNPHFSFSPL